MQSKIFSKSVLKQHVTLLYNGCNLEFYIDCSQWEITWKKSILNPQIVVDFVTKMWKQFYIFFSLVKKPNYWWSKLSLYNCRKTQERVGFNVSNTIFGKFPCHYHKVINFIILHVKQYIFTCLMQNNMPNFCGLLCYLNLKYKVEKYAANQSFKWHIFEKQWSLFQNIFEE